MTTPLATTAYDRVFALDTQMVFEARPLEQLDWASLSGGPILLLVLPQVSSEIDARERDGRLGQRARHVNRLLDLSIETGMWSRFPSPNPTWHLNIDMLVKRTCGPPRAAGMFRTQPGRSFLTARQTFTRRLRSHSNERVTPAEDRSKQSDIARYGTAPLTQRDATAQLMPNRAGAFHNVLEIVRSRVPENIYRRGPRGERHGFPSFRKPGR